MNLILHHFSIGSKKAHQTTTGIGAKPGQIQVIYNGKIATPQSLLPRKTASQNYTSKRMTSRLTATEVDEPLVPSTTGVQVMEEKDEKESRNISKKLTSHTSMRK